MKTLIKDKLQLKMNQLMVQILQEHPFNSEIYQYLSLDHAAFIPDEVFKGSHFLHHFSSSIEHLWKDLAVSIAENKFRLSISDHIISGTIKEGRLRRIAQVLNRLAYGGKQKKRPQPNWESECSYILKGRGGEIPVQVNCDIYAENEQTGERVAFELKAPLPNSDQTKVSKEKLLKLVAMTTPQVDGAFFALPYNPYGAKEKYDWSFPNRWFNMKQDKCVLIGDEFWEKIGRAGTYQAFITAVNEISTDYKVRIYREFLGIEPPAGFDKFL